MAEYKYSFTEQMMDNSSFSDNSEKLFNTAKGIRIMFYMVPDIQYSKLEEVPAYLEKAVPYVLFLIALEAIVAYARGKTLYKQNDTFMSMNLMIIQSMFGMWTQSFSLSAYIYVFEHYRLLTIAPESPITWIGLFLGVDFLYYWLHRFIHEYHIGWSTHSVHHSGERYNLATALRQGVYQPIFSFFFKIGLALFFHPACFVAHSALNTLYQFWIHTQLIGWLGPLEYVLNTASHHRVHHTVDRCNANYAGVLIIWDRMFGTFVPEALKEERDFYGLAKQYETFDPVAANVEHGRRMIQNIDGGGQGILNLIFKRRFRHKLVFRPLALFEPIPVPKTYGNWELYHGEPKRKHLDGDESSYFPPLQWYVLGLMVLNFASFIAVGLGTKKGLIDSSYKLATAHFWMIMLMISIGRLSDSYSAGKLINSMRIILNTSILHYWVTQNGMSPYSYSISILDALLWGLVVMSIQNFHKTGKSTTKMD